MYSLESHYQTATRSLTVTDLAGTAGGPAYRAHDTAARTDGQWHDRLPYFSLIARRNWRIMSRELCSIVASW